MMLKTKRYDSFQGKAAYSSFCKAVCSPFFSNVVRELQRAAHFVNKDDSCSILFYNLVSLFNRCDVRECLANVTCGFIKGC
jgi:hypothetical protein